jgi:hypothetical protein
MATLATKTIRIYEQDVQPLRLIAEVEGCAAADIMHAAITEYVANHRDELASAFGQAQQAVRAGDLEALTAVVNSSARARGAAAAARNADL